MPRRVKSEPLVRSKFEWGLEAVSLIALLIMILLPLSYYSQLPEQVPIHFNFKGEPDGYGAKKFIWIISGIGLFISILFNATIKVPEQYNYPTKINEDNIQAIYRINQHYMIWLKTVIMLLFAFISVKIIVTSFNGYQPWFSIILWLLIIAMFAVILRLYMDTKRLSAG